MWCPYGLVGGIDPQDSTKRSFNLVGFFGFGVIMCIKHHSAQINMINHYEASLTINSPDESVLQASIEHDKKTSAKHQMKDQRTTNQPSTDQSINYQQPWRLYGWHLNAAPSLGTDSSMDISEANNSSVATMILKSSVTCYVFI